MSTTLFLDSILHEMDKVKLFGALLIDLLKFFDTIGQSILLNKLPYDIADLFFYNFITFSLLCSY